MYYYLLALLETDSNAFTEKLPISIQSRDISWFFKVLCLGSRIAAVMKVVFVYEVKKNLAAPLIK